MLMNRIETMAVNSPPRRALQRYVETPILRRLGGRVAGAHALEIGCGSGFGSRLILDQFGAARLDAVDLDPAMVQRARRRLYRYGDRVRIEQGSVTDLATVAGRTDPVYDAVFDFAIIHHIEDLRSALHEVARMLKPGGKFYFVEVTATALARPSYRRLFDHPEQDRFTAGEFLAGLHGAGLDAAERWTTLVGGDYLLGVATREGHIEPRAC